MVKEVLAENFGLKWTCLSQVLTEFSGKFLNEALQNTVELLLKDEHKAQRKKFANWVRKKFWKEDIMTILFSDEKTFDLDDIYSSQNDRIWAANRKEANRRGGKKRARKVCRKRDDMVSRVLRGRCAPCSV